MAAQQYMYTDYFFLQKQYFKNEHLKTGIYVKHMSNKKRNLKEGRANREERNAIWMFSALQLRQQLTLNFKLGAKHSNVAIILFLRTYVTKVTVTFLIKKTVLI